MTKKKVVTGSDAINPDAFYRLSIDGQKFFGYGPTVLNEKIAAGEIPRPVLLGDSDKARARGWFGRDIQAWQAERKAAPLPAPRKSKPGVAAAVPAAKVRGRQKAEA
jgi:predicted DNA-binding transcriptional regulator AlpA